MNLECPSCEVENDYQDLLAEGGCPNCGTELSEMEGLA